MSHIKLLNDSSKIPATIFGITSKRWCQVAIAVGILVVMGVGGFGIIGLLHSYGIIQAPSWLAPAIEIAGATPHFWSLWVIVIGSVVLGGSCIGLGLYGSLKESALENPTKDEHATSLPTSTTPDKTPLEVVEKKSPELPDSGVAQPTHNSDLQKKLWDNYSQELQENKTTAQVCEETIAFLEKTEQLTADQTIVIWKRLLALPYSEYFDTPAKIDAFYTKLLPKMDLKAQDSEGNTMLHDLCSHGLLSDTIVFFFKFFHEYSFETYNFRQETPFHIAFKNPNSKPGLDALAQFATKDQLMQKDQDGYTPLYYALKMCISSTISVTYSFMDIIKHMIAKKAIVSNPQHSRALLESILKYPDLETCEILLKFALPTLESGINTPSSKGLTPFEQLKQNVRFSNNPKIHALFMQHGALH